MADWRTIRRAGVDDDVLEKLTEAAALYDAYLVIAKPNVYPAPADLQADVEAEDADAAQPLGLLMHPGPIGIALYRNA